MTLEHVYEQYFCYCQYSRKYLHAAKADNSPHIFAVADQSYQCMVHNQHHQVITALFSVPQCGVEGGGGALLV